MSDWEKFQRKLAETLRKRRFALGMSQQMLAEKSGFHRSYVADIERLARDVSLKSAWRLAACLGIRLSLIIEEAEEQLLPASKKSRR